MCKDSERFLLAALPQMLPTFLFAGLRRMLIYFNMGVVLAKAFAFSAFV